MECKGTGFEIEAKHMRAIFLVTLFCLGLVLPATAQISPVSVPADNDLRPADPGIMIHVNQVAYDSAAPKFAVLETDGPLDPSDHFQIEDARTSSKVFEGTLANGQGCPDWFPGRYFYRLDFSRFRKPGHFRLLLEETGMSWESYDFEIGDHLLETEAVPAIIGFFHHQRANSPQELEADSHLLLFGSTNTVRCEQILLAPGLRQLHVAAANPVRRVVHDRHRGYRRSPARPLACPAALDG
jgi:hypothetical protein